MNHRTTFTLAIALFAITLTGCIGVTINRTEDHPTRTAIEESRLVEWTLDSNLSRDDVGLAEGERSVIYDSPDKNEPFQARLDLGEGTMLDQTVKYVAAWAEDGESAPCSFTVNHYLMSADEAEEVLSTYQQALSLDGDRVSSWRAHHDSVVAAGDSGTVARSLIFNGSTVGVIAPTVEVGTNRGTGNVLVTVDLRRC